MGRGRGGYTEKQVSYKNSGGNKVIDNGSIYVAERYIDMGYEAVFRQEHPPNKTYDLSIKSSDDINFLKNIEVKKINSSNPSKIATNIEKANKQISKGDTIALFISNHSNSETGKKFVEAGIAEAKRKGLIHGPIEIWFNDKTHVVY